MRRAAGAAGVAGAAAGMVLAYERWGKPWQQQWGATDEEASMPLPGDEHVADPAQQVTRAVTVAAPPHAVWPWVVQLGADRGGFYSYDRLENLFGLRIHSAGEIVPEWQDLAVGDLVRGDRAGTGGWYVVELVPDEALVMKLADVKAGRPVRRDEQLGWEFLWTFALRPTPSGGTRLLVRERTAIDRPATRALLAPVGLVSFVMTRRMLLGIRDRAEQHHATSAGVRLPA